MSEPIHKFLSSLLQQSDDWKFDLIKNWPTIFGDMSRHVTCEKIERDIITLGVYDSCWMQELYLLTPTLLHALNTHLKAQKVTQIRFKKVARKPLKKVTPPLQQMPAPPKILTAPERATLARVNDEELRTALKNFLVRCHYTRQM